MSHVLNVVLTVGFQDEDMAAGSSAFAAPLGVLAINRTLADEHGRTRGLARVDDSETHRYASGGSKVLEAEVWTAALNHVAPSTMIELVCRYPWSEPAGVWLGLQDQGDDCFRFATVEQWRERGWS